MMFKKLLSLWLCAVFLVSVIGEAVAAIPETVQAKLIAVEVDTYGAEQVGALADRISRLEKAYDGANGKGSIMSRMDSLCDQLYSNGQRPSLLAQLNAIEWGINHEVSMKPVLERLTEMETSIQGKTTEGTFRARIAQLAEYAFGSETLPITQVNVPADTLIKISLVTPVSTKNIKVGDTVKYQVAEDVIENGMLLFAKGEPGEGTVTEVVQARNFGRDAKLTVDFRNVKAMDGTVVDTFIGEEAKKQMQSLAMAAGASLAGIALLGPIGIIGGAFIKGKNIELPEGTELYIQTKADTTLYGVVTAER